MILRHNHLRCGSLSTVHQVSTTLLAGIFVFCGPPLTAQPNGSAAAWAAAAGWQAYEASRLIEAETLLNKAVRLAPAVADYQAALAEIDASLGEEPTAIQHFKRAILLKPNDTEFRLDLARLLQKKGNDREALRILHLANPSPELAGPWHFARGFSLFRLGNYLSAGDEFKRLLEKPGYTSGTFPISTALARYGSASVKRSWAEAMLPRKNDADAS